MLKNFVMNYDFPNMTLIINDVTITNPFIKAGVSLLFVFLVALFILGVASILTSLLFPVDSVKHLWRRYISRGLPMIIDISNFNVSINEKPVTNPIHRVACLAGASLLIALIFYLLAAAFIFVCGLLVAGVPHGIELVSKELRLRAFLIYAPVVLCMVVVFKKIIRYFR